jgi:hypothetical protein
MHLKMSLQYLGIPINTKSFMSGVDNTVVFYSTIPHSSLNKQRKEIAYHRHYWIDGKANPMTLWINIGDINRCGKYFSQYCFVWVTLVGSPRWRAKERYTIMLPWWQAKNTISKYRVFLMIIFCYPRLKLWNMRFSVCPLLVYHAQ